MPLYPVLLSSALKDSNVTNEHVDVLDVHLNITNKKYDIVPRKH